MDRLDKLNYSVQKTQEGPQFRLEYAREQSIFS